MPPASLVLWASLRPNPWTSPRRSGHYQPLPERTQYCAGHVVCYGLLNPVTAWVIAAMAPSCPIAPSVWGQGPRISMLHPAQQPWCQAAHKMTQYALNLRNTFAVEHGRTSGQSNKNQILDLIRRQIHPPIMRCFCISVLLCWTSEYLLDWSGYLVTLPAMHKSQIWPSGLDLAIWILLNMCECAHGSFTPWKWNTYQWHPVATSALCFNPVRWALALSNRSKHSFHSASLAMALTLRISTHSSLMLYHAVPINTTTATSCCQAAAHKTPNQSRHKAVLSKL